MAQIDSLKSALQENPFAQAAFDALPASHRRKYIQWIDQAKRDDTRRRRIAQTIDRVLTGQRKKPSKA